MRDVRFALVRGEFHNRLVATIRDRIGDGITQESLAKHVKMHQTTVSGILKRDAGTFDLDEASAALEHVGAGSLADFVAGVPPPPVHLATRLAAALLERPKLMQLVEDLLDAPKTQHADVVELVRNLVLPAIATRGGKTRGPRIEPTAAPRTTKAPKKRR
jgi:hypothetical protein